MYDDDNSGILKRNMFSLIYGTARGTAAMNEMPCIFHYYFYIDHYYTNINHSGLWQNPLVDERLNSFLSP